MSVHNKHSEFLRYVAAYVKETLKWLHMCRIVYPLEL